MSLRNRIVVAGLLLTLIAPAAGWGLTTVRDPDGQQLTVAIVSVDDSDRTQTGVDSAFATVGMEPTAQRDGVAFVFDRFQDWLRALFSLSC
jgi:hypothetical protein